MNVMLVLAVVVLFMTVVPRKVTKALTLVVTPPILGLAVGGFLWTMSLFIVGVPDSWHSLFASLTLFVVASSMVIFVIMLWALYFNKE